MHHEESAMAEASNCVCVELQTPSKPWAQNQQPSNSKSAATKRATTQNNCHDDFSFGRRKAALILSEVAWRSREARGDKGLLRSGNPQACSLKLPALFTVAAAGAVLPHCPLSSWAVRARRAVGSPETQALWRTPFGFNEHDTKNTSSLLVTLLVVPNSIVAALWAVDLAVESLSPLGVASRGLARLPAAQRRQSQRPASAR